MREIDVQGEVCRRLRELGDPEFITRWAILRYSLFFIATERPEYAEIKHEYDAAAIEYRRRMNGGLAAAKLND
jgi:hypothetical protein